MPESEKKNKGSRRDILVATDFSEARLQPVDMKLLPWTYAWPKRMLCFVIWKIPPFRWITRLIAQALGKINPYCKVVGVYQPKFRVGGPMGPE